MFRFRITTGLRCLTGCVAISLLAATSFTTTLLAQEKTDKPSTAEAALAQPDSTTEGSVTVNGQAIAYTAVAGTLTVGATDAQDAELGLDGKLLPEYAPKNPEKPEDAAPTARIFYVAYFKKGAPGEKRPITFLYNGGPGSSTMWLHMGCFGPRRVLTPGTDHPAGAPYSVVNNDYSLLDSSDLVFIDAPGTGFSRIFGKDKEKAFWGLDPDAHAFERFIRRFLTKYSRWNSPKYLMGESYGTPRSAVLSNDLRAVDLNGIILLSTILSFDNSVDEPHLNPGVDQAYALALPTYAATAWYHHKLPNPPATIDPLVSEVEAWALGDYMHALLEGATLSQADRQAIAEKLHSYTGLPVAYLLKSNLRVEGGAFSKMLLDDSDTTTGRLDTRFQGPDYDPLSEEADYDPQSNAVSSAYTTAINSYLRDDLKYGANWTYKPSAYRDPGFHWQYRRAEGGQNVMPDLAHTMKANPATHVFVAGGYYDLATPYFEGKFEMLHLPIPQDLQKNIQYHYYPAGHMIYVNDEVLKHFHSDVAAFIQSTENGAAK
uniref:Carboxypeptidase-related protein n=1 Tax=mine drainage metagenome TaxID=410659 RepID=E6QKE0_9ZZZZ